MSATLLLRAAGRIRQTAHAATTGPWQADHSEEDNSSVRHPDSPWWDGYAYAGRPEDAEHIASWAPDVALLVADVLTMAAIRHADLTTEGGPDDADFALTPAQADDVLRTELTLARRILGEEQ